MYNAKIEANISVTDETDLNRLANRVADHLRLLANPVRDDQGILTIISVRIHTDARLYPTCTTT